MRRSFLSLRAVSFAIIAMSFGCDAASSSSSEDLGKIEARDPEYEGIDQDLGTEDIGETPVQRHGRLRVVGRHLVDEAGERVQLKGVSSMWLNWENDGYAESASALRWMRNSWNLSVIRAAMGITPEGAYLSDPERARGQVETIVDNAIDAGVYVIVDWHDHDAHRRTDAAVEFFSEISAKYAGVPNVLYETFNEPLDISWKNELKPYHEAVVAAIRANDPEAIIILGTPRYSQVVEVAATDPVEGENLMYTLHFYACDHSFRSSGDYALSKGIALFVTEWGATSADGGRDGVVCKPQAQMWIDWMRARNISWAAWKLDNCVPDSTCFLTPDAPLEGGWTNEYLRGHGPFVRGRIQE